MLGALVLISALILAWWFWWGGGAWRPAPVDNILKTGAVQKPGEIHDLPPAGVQRLEEEKNYPLGLKQFAYSFAERYGSYSNNAMFQNLEDLRPLMTPAMREKVDKLITLHRAAALAYDGYTTKALSGELINFSETAATVMVRTQRLHYQNDKIEPTVFYQNIFLQLVKAGTEWQVDDARWQE